MSDIQIDCKAAKKWELCALVLSNLVIFYIVQNFDLVPPYCSISRESFDFCRDVLDRLTLRCPILINPSYAPSDPRTTLRADTMLENGCKQRRECSISAKSAVWTYYRASRQNKTKICFEYPFSYPSPW